MLYNSLLRVAIIFIIVLVAIIFGNLKIKINRLLLSILIIFLFGELITLYKDGYNLLHYAVLATIQLSILAYIVKIETKKNKLIVLCVSIVYSFFLFFLFTEHSTANLLDWNVSIKELYPIGTNQYYDYMTIINLFSIIMVFFWLHTIVNSDSTNRRKTQSTFIFIFSFLALYGGTFFILAFGRVLSENQDYWSGLWSNVYLPIYILSSVSLCIGVLWE